MAPRTLSLPASKAHSFSGTSSGRASGKHNRRGEPMRSLIRCLRVVAPMLIAGASLPAQQARTTWKEFLGGPDSSHYSALKQINTRTVDKLEMAWSYSTGDELSYTFSPLVVDNVAYVAAKTGSLVALDATNGKALWVPVSI